jgi:hypothetical protein
LLNPACCLNTQQPLNFSDLPLTEFILENQWRKIALIDWKMEFVLNNFVIPNNVLDGSGQQIFKELSSVVFQ